MKAASDRKSNKAEDKRFEKQLIREDRYTDAVDELIIKLSKAKKKKVRIV